MRHIVLLAMLLAVGCNGVVMTRNWSQSAAAPSNFEPWTGSEAIKLPATRKNFVDFIERVGASYYLVGPGETLAVPIPKVDSPCRATAAGIVFSFPIERGTTVPRYVAYVGDGDLIECVDQQFSFLGP